MSRCRRRPRPEDRIAVAAESRERAVQQVELGVVTVSFAQALRGNERLRSDVAVGRHHDLVDLLLACAERTGERIGRVRSTDEAVGRRSAGEPGSGVGAAEEHFRQAVDGYADFRPHLVAAE